MPLNIRNEEVNRLAERVVSITGQNETEALPLRERLRPIQDRIAARVKTGEEAEKEFYDALSGGD